MSVSRRVYTIIVIFAFLFPEKIRLISALANVKILKNKNRNKKNFFIFPYIHLRVQSMTF